MTVHQARATRLSALMMLAFLASACGSDPASPGSGEPTQYNITLTVSRDTLRFVGDTVTVTATVRDEAGQLVTAATPTWRTNDGSVRVDAGLVRAVRQGNADVVASVGRSSGHVRIVVDQAPTALRADSASVSTAPRGVIDIPVSVLDAGGTVIPHLREAVSWSATDTSIALVDREGRILARAEGTTVVTGKLEDLEATATVVVGHVAGPGEFRVWSEDGTVLAGILDLPSGSGPFPGLVRIHGSGPTGRSNGVFLSNQVIPAGIAVMRYDKRGVGQSEGIYSGVGPANSEAVLADLAEDAAAWLEFLTYNDAIDASRLGILGVSQGGWICPLVASISPYARYMINVVGPTITVGQQIYYQTLTGSTGQGQNNSGLSDEQLFQMVRDFGGPHGYDPVPTLRTLAIPGLWVLGTKDYLVPYGPTVEILDDLVDELGADYSVITLTNGTHGTRDRTTQQLIPWWEGQDGGFSWLSERGFLDQPSSQVGARQ